MVSWQPRLKAAGIHFGIILGVALAAALLVFTLWYPYPYREISGGRELFLILVAVDVVLGPLITLAVFDRRKSLRELRMDLSVVALLQLAALGYGLWTVAVARPVHLVFEVDRLRVVHAVEVPLELMDRADPRLATFPWSGPTPLAVRPFRDAAEGAEATLVALGGVSLSARADLWQPYEVARPRVLQAARPVSALRQRFAPRAAEIDAVLRAAGRSADNTVYLPMVGRKSFWTAFLDPVTAQPIAFMPLDSF
jgi:hypothetical protein